MVPGRFDVVNHVKLVACRVITLLTWVSEYPLGADESAMAAIIQIAKIVG
jgi:hypothetical protein